MSDNAQGFGGLTDTTPSPQASNFRSNRWKPTGEGDFPAINIRPVAASNGFMFLRNPAAQGKPQKRFMRMWVSEINIGWSMDYRQAQTVYGKSFYPRHIQYSNAVIKGQTASQKHYDEIVDMVLSYQAASILPGVEDDQSSSFDIVRFEMPAVGYYVKSAGKAGPWVKGDGGDDKTFYRYDRIFFDGYPIRISAGHRKGVFNPEFEITFLVAAYSNDVLASGSAIDTEKEFISRIKTGGSPGSNPLTDSGYNSYVAPAGAESNQGAIEGGTGGNQG